MFHKFSATPAKAPSQAKGSGSARASKNKKKNSDADSNNPSPEHTVFPLAKRQKAARACDRCRLHRIKCDEQKPWRRHQGTSSSVLPPRSPSPSPTHTACRCNSDSTSSSTANTSTIGPSVLPSVMSMIRESSRATRTPPDNVLNLAHVQSPLASGQLTFSHTSALAGCLFPQLPHPAVPSGERPLASNALLKSHRSYYLRLFWDVCHPLLQIMSETEFAELDALPQPTMCDEYSARSALVDSMIALGIQHSHASGLAGRILGLQQPPSRQYYHAGQSPEATWPGFEYFHRCRECMRTNTDVTLEALRCHALMVLYLMKGSAFRDAYNLLGITVRKAYIAKLHRLPPSHLSEAGKTARMQLWWMLFSLDLQCSLQLNMPPASQKSLVKCPFPAEDALARYVSSPSHREEGMNAYTYSIRLVNLAVIVTDIGACVSTADLVDDYGNCPAALERHALNLSSALQSLEVWHNQLPSELLLSKCENGPSNTVMLDFDRHLALPTWLQRQTVLLELHYHNTYTLIQRPFIRLRYTYSNGASGMITPPDSQQPHMEHIASALYHATIIVDTVFTVCSMSDVLYGWSEVLQPLWNATLTIMAYVYVNSPSPVAPRALDSLTRAQAVFESFSPTCPTALSAKCIVQSLASSLQNMMVHGSCAVANDDPMGWDLFASLLDEQQASPAGLESAPSSNNLYGNVLFSPSMPSASHINTPDFNSVIMQFSDS
ncbi:fungal-specific transcription factor domain-containing protein [Lipomyces kononenkoae]